jgi:hypothetical protein
LLAEWSCTSSVCPVCRNAGVHQTDCAMDLAISERGYCTRVERDRGRTFIASLARTLPPPDADSSDPDFDSDPDDGGEYDS